MDHLCTVVCESLGIVEARATAIFSPLQIASPEIQIKGLIRQESELSVIFEYLRSRRSFPLDAHWGETLTTGSMAVLKGVFRVTRIAEAPRGIFFEVDVNLVSVGAIWLEDIPEDTKKEPPAA